MRILTFIMPPPLYQVSHFALIWSAGPLRPHEPVSFNRNAAPLAMSCSTSTGSPNRVLPRSGTLRANFWTIPD